MFDVEAFHSWGVRDIESRGNPPPTLEAPRATGVFGILGGNVKRLLIVYHSQGGKTQRMADAVHRGACEETSVETRLQRAFDTSVHDVLDADGYVLGTPENFGYMSGALKDFFDRTYYPTEGKLSARPYAVFIGCSNDGSGALRNIERIVKGMQLRLVAEPVIVRGEMTPEDEGRCLELGQAIAAGMDLGIF